MGGPNDENCYQIRSSENTSLIYIFKTTNRKRKGQLNKFCSRYLDTNWDINYESKGLTKDKIIIFLAYVKYQ